MNTVFSNNLKKFRLQKKLTQEQVAEYLRVSTHTVSRWECSTTLPDVTLLPEIARLYCVTVDDFFKDTSSAYENYAQRLASVYEESKEPEDFILVVSEFKKLIKTGEYSLEDLRMYGLVHQYMMSYCQNKALDLYNTVIEKGKDNPDKTYWLTKYAKANLYVLIGKTDEFIDSQLQLVKQNSENADELCILIRTLYYAQRYEEAYKYFSDAKLKFNNCGKLFSVGGDICRKLKKYPEALEYLNRASELNNGFLMDGKYSKARCYEELGEYKKAYDVWREIVEGLKEGGYDIEATKAEKSANVCLEKMNK